jgi:peptidoglycan/xylan/chitin deacetylase (PgdA/CDA1 family)
MYHALAETPSVISVLPKVFAWQMQWLHKNGYQAVSLGRLVDYLIGDAELPERSIVITFDDGFAGVFTNAFPVLQQYGFSATVFLVSNYCGKDNYWPGQPTTVPRLPLMTWSQIREMDRHQIEFGGHTANHPPLHQLSIPEIENEVLNSKLELESQLGHSINMFAYPYGQYNAAVKSIVGQVYRGAVTTRLGMVQTDADPLELQRIEMLYLNHPRVFGLINGPLFPHYLAIRSLGRSVAATLLNRAWK